MATAGDRKRALSTTCTPAEGGYSPLRRPRVLKTRKMSSTFDFNMMEPVFAQIKEPGEIGPRQTHPGGNAIANI